MNWGTAKDVLTFSFAAVGAVLGVMNTLHLLDQRRVRLRVVPKMAYPITMSGEMMQGFGCIEVTNLSAFAVTVGDVGFTGGSPKTSPRAAIVRPIIHDGKPWPRRLESRESVSVYFQAMTLRPEMTKAYALTDCGEVAYGHGPAISALHNK